MLTADIRNARIERYFPDVLANAKEFKALGATVDPELVALWRALWKQMLNTFVYDIDLDGAARWEEMLSIRPPAGATLNSRKKAILARINANVAYTHRGFQNMLDGIYGAGNVVIGLEYNEYELWLDMTAGVITQNKAIRRLARVVVPANLALKVSHTLTTSIEQFAGAVISFVHRVEIPYKDGFSFDDIDSPAYQAAAVVTCKHIIIGGQ